MAPHRTTRHDSSTANLQCRSASDCETQVLCARATTPVLLTVDMVDINFQWR